MSYMKDFFEDYSILKKENAFLKSENKRLENYINDFLLEDTSLRF